MALKPKTVKKRRSVFFWLTGFVCILTVLVCFSCNATSMTYYVDYDKGSDSNKGTSPSLSFKHCPGDANAVDNAGETKLKAGDKVIFKGGTVYKGAILFQWSGSTGKDIVYDGNSANTFGNGKAIMDGDNMIYPGAFEGSKKVGFKTLSTAVNYLKNKGFTVVHDVYDRLTKRGFISIANFEIRGYAKYGILLDTLDNIIVKNCHINRISDWNLSRCSGNACNMDYVHNLGIGILITGASRNIVIDGCEVERTGHGGIKVQGESQDVEVKNCDVHDYIHWMMDISPLSNTHVLSNISIHDNKFRNLYHYASSWWISRAGGGEHPDDEKTNPGTGENPHLDGIFIRNPCEGVLENIRIYNNEFYTERQFSDNGGTAMLFASQIGPVDSVYIYNNIFQYCYMHLVMSIYATGGEVHIYNNTFYMPDKSAIRISGTGKFYVKNNIFHLENGLTLNTDDKDARQAVQSDYNIFRQGGRNLIYDGTWIGELSEWQMASKQDRNSRIVTDVKFVSPQNIQNSGKSNLRLQADSPGINRGVDLSDYFDTDKAGNRRPRGEPWDIGAYQHEEKQ